MRIRLITVCFYGLVLIDQGNSFLCNRKRKNGWFFPVRNPLYRLASIGNITRLHFFPAIWTFHNAPSCKFQIVESEYITLNFWFQAKLWLVKLLVLSLINAKE